MTRQSVGGKGLSTGKGLLVVASVLALLMLASALLSALTRAGAPYFVTGSLFLLFGAGLGAFVFYRYVVAYQYTLDGVKLTVERVYSRRPRFMAQPLLREIVFLGDESAAKAKYPGVRAQRAVRRDCPLEKLALVYRRAGDTRMLILQPDEDTKTALRAAMEK